MNVELDRFFSLSSVMFDVDRTISEFERTDAERTPTPTFWLELAAADGPQEALETRPAATLAEVGPASRRHRTILHVEDSASNIKRVELVDRLLAGPTRRA